MTYYSTQTGAAVDIPARHPVPMDCTPIAPPTTVGGQELHWYMGAWMVGPLPVAPVDEAKELADAQAAKIAEAAAACDAVLNPLGAEYGAWEKQTWDQQAVEAAALMADPTLEPAPAAGTTDKIPCIRAMATSRGMGLVELAQRILVNREAWLALSGNCIGQRQKIYDAVKACKKADDVRAIVVNIALPTA